MKATDTLIKLYKDPKTCAELVGLVYASHDEVGYSRERHGKGFSYVVVGGNASMTTSTKKWITELVIPPAWNSVWISPNKNGHILATGIDERGRKQYMYHPKWRTMRDLIKFYRMIVFAAALPKIRRDINTHLAEPELSRDKVMAAMLWILDNCYIRVGNDIYFEANESIGLTTLTDENVVIAGPVVTLSFMGKSSKAQQITFENKAVATLLDELRKVRGARLFRYKTEQGWKNIDADDINDYLHQISGNTASAKDFRTWGGTLLAFDYLIEEDAKKESQKPDKAVIAAVDQAAAVLGNTRTVARASYVHPDLLNAYGHRNFNKYYASAVKRRKVAGLDKRESELLHFLEELFEAEFVLLKTS